MCLHRLAVDEAHHRLITFSVLVYFYLLRIVYLFFLVVCCLLLALCSLLQQCLLICLSFLASHLTDWCWLSWMMMLLIHWCFKLNLMLWAQVGLCHCLAARTEGSGRASPSWEHSSPWWQLLSASAKMAVFLALIWTWQMLSSSCLSHSYRSKAALVTMALCAREGTKEGKRARNGSLRPDVEQQGQPRRAVAFSLSSTLHIKCRAVGREKSAIVGLAWQLS